MPVPERNPLEGLGINRTLPKEALRLLEIEGLIGNSLSRRPRVANPLCAQFSGNFMVLTALEGLAGELARGMATEENCVGCRSPLAHARKFRLRPQFEIFRRDMACHTVIFSCFTRLAADPTGSTIHVPSGHGSFRRKCVPGAKTR